MRKTGVEQHTMKRSDGSTEVVEGAYTIYHESGVVTNMCGINLATAKEFKRICDFGFTDIEIERMQNGEPFSDNPDVNCDRLLLDMRNLNEWRLIGAKASLKKLIRMIVTCNDEYHGDDRNDINRHLEAIQSAARYIRQPEYAVLVAELEQLRLSDNKEIDKNYLSSIIDKIQAELSTTFPDLNLSNSGKS